MKPRVLYAVRGTCGAGKSWLRRHLFSDKLPVIDMADGPKDVPYPDRMRWFKEKLTAVTGDVVIEGIFAPNSPSWRRVNDLAYELGFIVMSITVSSPIEFCLANTAGNATRTELVHKYHSQFNN